MLRKDPEMTFEILHSVLKFAIHGFVKLFHEPNSRGFHFAMMRIDVIEKNRKALQVVAKFRRGSSIRF